MFSYRSDNGKMLMGKIPKKAMEVAKEVWKVYLETNMIEKESCEKAEFVSFTADLMWTSFLH